MTDEGSIMGVAKQNKPGSVTELAKLLDREGTGGRGRRSALTSWLWTHHDEFAVMLEEREPKWTKVASHLMTMGLSNGKGGPLTGDRVRQTWWNVKQMRARAMAKSRTGAAAPVMAKDEIAPAVRVIAAIATTENTRTGPALNPKQAVPRNAISENAHAEAPSSPNAIQTTSTSPAKTTSDAMKTIRNQINARNIPMPTPMHRTNVRPRSA